MKNKTLKTIAFLGLILAIGTINSCKISTEGLQVTLNTNISTSNLNFRVINVSSTTTETPQNLKIKLIGAGSNYIYNWDGSKNIKTVEGFFSLMLEPGETVSPENPVSFTVLVEADGYLDGIYPVQISSSGYRSYTIPIVKLSEPPKGASVKQETIKLNSRDETETSIFIETPITTGKQEMAKIEIPAGTKMFDENGKTVTGTINASLVHFDNRSEESLRSFTGGFMATNVVDTNGQPMEPMFFETAGFVSIEMNNGTQTVKTFSKPLLLNMEVNPETSNPKTGLAIMEGDSIPTWSLDTKTGQWKREGTVVVVKNTNTNKFETVIVVPHLTIYNLWWNGIYKCDLDPEITIISNTEEVLYKKMQLICVNPNYIYDRILYDHTINVKNNEKTVFQNAPKTNMYLKIYNGDNTNSGILVQSSNFTCGAKVNINVTVPIINPIIKIDFEGKCPGGRIIKPSGNVYFREENASSWNLLGNATNGYIASNELIIGKTYVFGAALNGFYMSILHTGKITQVDNFIRCDLPDGTTACD